MIEKYHEDILEHVDILKLSIMALQKMFMKSLWVELNSKII